MFRCRRCTREGRLYHHKLCIRCTVTDRIAALSTTAPATSTRPWPRSPPRWPRPDTHPGRAPGLAEQATQPRPAARPRHPDAVADPRRADRLPRPVRFPTCARCSSHCGALPEVDRQLLDFEAWLTRRLDGLADHPHERLLRQFGLWHQLPRMRTKAALAPLTPPARTYAQLEFIHATAFCTWLAEHGHHPTELGQLDLDRYYTALKIGHRQSLRGFLNWSMTSRDLPTLTFARTRFTTGEALTHTQPPRPAAPPRQRPRRRRRAPLRMRVAACVLLLYAQPVTRIMTLTIDDIVDEDGAMTLRLGDPPAPVPEPFAALVRRLLAQRPADSTSRWLFPGRRPGQPLSYVSLSQGLRDLVSRYGSPASPPSASSPPATRPGHRQSPRVPPHHHPPPDHPRRRDLEPLRRARPSSGAENTRR